MKGYLKLCLELVIHSLDCRNYSYVSQLKYKIYVTPVFMCFIFSRILFSYPELQEHTTQFYTQEQIKDLVSYAGDRGIRVIPEVESA